MAQFMSPIFNKKATEKLRNPDDLDKYVRVTNPSLWVVLVACLALLAGLFAWGVFGAVSTSVNTTGVVVELDRDNDPNTAPEKVALCFLPTDDFAKVHVGDTANVGGEMMKVGTLPKVPSSPEEWTGELASEYLVQTLFKDDWAYPIIFEGDASELDVGVPVAVNITTERIAPISLILKGRG